MVTPTSTRRHRTPDQISRSRLPTGQTPVPHSDLTSVKGLMGSAQGEIIAVTGRVLNLDGEPVRGVPVTIWQANSFGRYVHANDPNPVLFYPNFAGCVGIRSDSNGVYRIKTVKPGAYPAGPGWMRPPHIHFEVHGQFERLITQMYFPDEPLNASDRLLNAALRPSC